MLRKKFTEFHSHLITVTTERDKALSIQNSLLSSQDRLKLKHRFLEISSQTKTSLFLFIVWLFLLGFLYLLFLDSNLSSSCLARYS
jgi:hypothetical protein